ncbi:MAG: hypothetical protein C4519_25035 [Desulfobacteraceae bacterium]|nr:MAG: hypothetical protein C4519_25035 [Desulfobacteraceae bacterium]
MNSSLLFDEIMRIAMALQTIGELGQQIGRVRAFMAILTFGNGRMAVLVAIGAAQIVMLGGIGSKHCENFVMARPTEPGIDIATVGDVEGAMRLMALQTILIGHEIGVRGVAFLTFIYRLVLLRMAQGAVLLAMLARVFLELGTLVLVAGKAPG